MNNSRVSSSEDLGSRGSAEWFRYLYYVGCESVEIRLNRHKRACPDAALPITVEIGDAWFVRASTDVSVPGPEFSVLAIAHKDASRHGPFAELSRENQRLRLEGGWVDCGQFALIDSGKYLADARATERWLDTIFEVRRAPVFLDIGPSTAADAAAALALAILLLRHKVPFAALLSEVLPMTVVPKTTCEGLPGVSPYWLAHALRKLSPAVWLIEGSTIEDVRQRHVAWRKSMFSQLGH